MVIETARKYSFAHLNEKNKAFENHSYDWYATDVYFQNSSGPTGTMQRPGIINLISTNYAAIELSLRLFQMLYASVAALTHLVSGLTWRILQSRRAFLIAAATKGKDK